MHKHFDSLAERISEFISSAYFFLFCLGVVIVWLPSRPFFQSNDEWQLPINTFTTIITFLMVALLENSNRRSSRAVHLKLDRILAGLVELPDTTDDRLDEAIEAERDA